jgi:hypothetical protein
VVPIKGLAGPLLANAMMKAVTKSKRRVTLSICGLGGYLDETELDTLPPDTKVVDVNPGTGEIRGYESTVGMPPTAPETPSGAEIDARVEALFTPRATHEEFDMATFTKDICRAFDEAQTRDEANAARLRWTQRPSHVPPDLEALGTAAYQRCRARFAPKGNA